MKDLPPGWQTVPIGDVCTVVGGSTQKTSVNEYWGGGIPWITPNDLSGHNGKYVSRGARSITQSGYDSCSTTLLPAGTVLFSSRAPIGYVAITASPVCTNQGFKSFVPSDAVRRDYLYWYLRFAVPDIRSMRSGRTFSEISRRSPRRFRSSWRRWTSSSGSSRRSRSSSPDSTPSSNPSDEPNAISHASELRSLTGP